MRKRSNFGKGKAKRVRTAPHNIADDFERSRHQKETEKFLRQLNEDGSPKKPLTESQIMGLCRGAIRERWMYSPVRLAYLNQHIVPDDDPNTRRRWKGTCMYCGKEFKKSDLQIDHWEGEHSLKSPDDLFKFYHSIHNITFNDLKMTCIPCHEIKTAMERYGLTEEEAVVFKKVTAWRAKYPKATQQKVWLKGKGFSAGDMKNAGTREAAVLKYYQQKQIDNEN